jgi:hypothetical protein
MIGAGDDDPAAGIGVVAPIVFAGGDDPGQDGGNQNRAAE